MLDSFITELVTKLCSKRSREGDVTLSAGLDPNRE